MSQAHAKQTYRMTCYEVLLSQWQPLVIDVDILCVCEVHAQLGRAL